MTDKHIPFYPSVDIFNISNIEFKQLVADLIEYLELEVTMVQDENMILKCFEFRKR